MSNPRSRTSADRSAVVAIFAQVYELAGPRGRWAVKCFTRSAADIRVRYAKIAKAIAQADLPYFVEFELLEHQMLVGGTRYPVVKMQWIEGLSLDSFIEANLGRAEALPLPDGDLSLTVVPRHGFWWTETGRAKPDVEKPRTKRKADTPKRSARVRRPVRVRIAVRAGRHPRALAAAAGGVIAVGVAAVASIQAGVLLACMTVLACLFECAVRYHALPALRRRRQLRARVRRLEATLAAQADRKSLAEHRLAQPAGRRDQDARRAKFKSDIDAINGRLSETSTKLKEARRELSQAGVPTFAEYLKQSL